MPVYGVDKPGGERASRLAAERGYVVGEPTEPVDFDGTGLGQSCGEPVGAGLRPGLKDLVQQLGRDQVGLRRRHTSLSPPAKGADPVDHALSYR